MGLKVPLVSKLIFEFIECVLCALSISLFFEYPVENNKYMIYNKKQDSVQHCCQK